MTTTTTTQEIKNIIDLLGTWTDGSQWVNFSNSDNISVRMTNSLGQSGLITASETLDRIDALRDDGWTR